MTKIGQKRPVYSKSVSKTKEASKVLNPIALPMWKFRL